VHAARTRSPRAASSVRDLNIFLDGIKQAVDGDPMGLVNAIGYPIAADTALLTVAGGVELLTFGDAAATIISDLSGPVS
jgi:hypothetical protein